MFLENFYNTELGRSMNKFAREASTFNACYLYWREQLFERVMRLFVWENTDPVPPKEIEQRLLIQGCCGVMPFKGELTAFYGTLHGVTKYIDEFTSYTARCPIWTGDKKIGTEIALINNTAIRNSIMPLIHHYSIMLGHVEVTLIGELVNARDANGVPVVTTEKQKKSVQEYQKKKFNGEWDVVTDPSMIGIVMAGAESHTVQGIMNIMETREKLIKSFYSDIGVRSAFEKRNNTVMAEVEADTSLLLLNLSDMIHCREEGAKEVNRMFGTNWTVHVAKEIDYGDENQRIQFDTNTEVHVKEKEEDVSTTSTD